jgi:choline dehydrogenase-like flavoprotein
VHAKADAHVICVEPALEHPNVTLLRKSRVTRLETDSSGRVVTKVHVNNDGVPEAYSADIIVSSCGAVNSAALMLRSASDKHPRGLANRSDQVGRNYMCHTNSVMLAISKCENPTVFQKTFGLNDFYFGSPDFEYPMGHISFVGKSDADILAAGAPRVVPGFTLDLMARHSLDFWMTSEDLPHADNRVTITRDGQIQLSYKPNNEEGHKRLQATLKSLLKHANCTEEVIHLNAYIGKRIPLAGVAHQNGTMRFGRDPRTSVLDMNCKAHDLDNLYVVDASFFPSCGAMNPALTIMANALRVGDHLLERLDARAEQGRDEQLHPVSN